MKKNDTRKETIVESAPSVTEDVLCSASEASEKRGDIERVLEVRVTQ